MQVKLFSGQPVYYWHKQLTMPKQEGQLKLSHADEYAGSAAKVIGRLTNEALKRHAVWADGDLAVRLAEMIPDETARQQLLTKVSQAVENAVEHSLCEGLQQLPTALD